jgi:glyoxylase-like metal-dependent hydrolase (beta-lactamase superfamily II)
METGVSSPFTNIDFIFVDGHTEKMMLPRINYNGRKILYVADLLPSTSHIPVPYVMGYDTRPLLTMDEKTQVLQQAVDENYVLFFEHDPYHACATVEQTEKGIRVKFKGSLPEMLS